MWTFWCDITIFYSILLDPDNCKFQCNHHHHQFWLRIVRWVSSPCHFFTGSNLNTIQCLMSNHKVPVYNKCMISQQTYLKYVIADVIYVNNGWVSITDLGAQHCPELRWPRHQYDLMSIKDSPLHPKLHITQLWIVDKFWIYPGASREWGVLDALDWFPTKTSWKDVCKQQRSSLVLED
jgi:hypothetical protein